MIQGIPSLMVARGSGSGGGGGWTQRASDNFTGTTLADLTTSGVWTANAGVMVYKQPQSGAMNNSGGLNLYSYTGVTFLTTQYVQGTLVEDHTTPGAPNIGIACRVQTGAASGYVLACDGTNIGLYRYDAGAFNSIQTIAETFTTLNRYRLEVTGIGSATRLTAYHDVGSGFVAVASGVDPGSPYYDGGSPGLSGFNANQEFEIGVWSAGDQ